MIETEYLNLLNAIRDYYGGDTALEVYTNRVPPSEFAELLKGLPNCDVVLNADGTVRSYHVNTTLDVGAVELTEYLNQLNSNTQGADKVKVSIPMNTTLDAESGNVLVESGAKIAGAGGAVATATVAKPKNWLVPLVAVGTLITIGKLTMPELYQEHPEFFGEGSLAQLDQEMWDEVTQERQHSEPAPIPNIGRVIDGFINTEHDTQTNKDTAVPYADAMAMAYIIKYCLEQGVFGTGESESEIQIGSETLNVYYRSAQSATWDDGTYTVEYTDFTTDDVVMFECYNSSRNLIECHLLSKYAGSCREKLTVKSTGVVSYGNRNFTQISGSNYYHYGFLIYSYNYTTHPDRVVSNIPRNSFSFNVSQYTEKNIAKCIFEGATQTQSGVEGINSESGATTPSFNPDDTYAQILEKIANDLPDLWDKRITQNVVQPDGTSKEYIYLPLSLPIPNPNPTDGKKPEDQPIAGNQGQSDTSIDPETTPEIILQITYDDIVSPRTPNDETTGNGNTPPVVIPTGSASALYSIYNPTNSEVNSFGGWLWSSNFVDQLLKMFNDPMQAIISLHKVFCTPSVSGRDDIKVGYLNSGVESNVVDSQYVTIPCGSVNISEYFQNVFDYPPYTEVSLYLPFIGIVKLDVDDVMRSTMSVTYNVDVLTGTCLVEVNVVRDSFGGVLYQYAGDCCVHYPLSSGSYMGIVSALVGAAGVVASGGALVPMALHATSTAMRGKASVERSGNFGGNSGAMACKKPYLIIKRPQVNVAEHKEHFFGLGANEYVIISQCTGHVKCSDVHLKNIPYTQEERDELEMLLRSGIEI